MSAATAATRFLDRRGIRYVRHEYDYRDRGGAPHAAASLGVPPGSVVKTLVLRDDAGGRMLVLMHGDREVSTKRLARLLGRRKIATCSPDEARRVTGYVVGGISPFGTRRELPVYVERTVVELPRMLINGGRRGLLLELDPAVLTGTLAAQPVDVAVT